jgi:hypothetical protein
MRRVFLLYVLVIFGTCTFSQEVCNDIIFASEGNKVIVDCCIKKVVEGNIVVYSQHGEMLRVPASAIWIDGDYMVLVSNDAICNERYIKDQSRQGLYRNHDYCYYKRLYDASKTMQAIGIMITSIGLGIEIFGLTTTEIESGSVYFDQYSKDIMKAGFIYVSIGVPLWISGAVRAANNEDAMKEIELHKSLAIGCNNNGLSLMYRF